MAVDLLTAFDSFARVARYRSYSDAAKELKVSQSTVSRHIALLEKRLHTTLLHRSTREVHLTTDGREFLTHAQAILHHLQMVNHLGNNRSDLAKGRVRLLTPVAFGLKLSIALKEFLDIHPEIIVEIMLTDYLYLNREDKHDLIVRVGELQEASLICRRLGSVTRRLVAAPNYLARCAPIMHPRDLSEHVCLASTYGGAASKWHFTNGAEIESVAVNGPLVSDNSYALTQAVVGGIGIGLIPDFLLSSDIERGALVSILPDWSVTPLPIYLTHDSRVVVAHRVRVFIDFLVKFAAAL